MEAAPSVSKKDKKMRIVVCRDGREVGERVAVMLAARSLEYPKTCVGLSVGATPTLCYSQIASMAIRGLADLSHCKFLVLDEFFGSSDAGAVQQPHLAEVDRAFFRPAGVAAKQIMSTPAHLNAQEAASSMKELLEVRRPNIFLLGMQPDGNIGWNTPLLSKDTGVHIVDISGATDAQNKGYDKCVSVGPKQLMEADELWVLAVARNKAQLVKEIVEDKEGKSVASWLLHNHPRAMLFADAAAASCLPTTMANHGPTFIKGYRIIDDSSIFSQKNIVCFSPHPDDTSISAGAALSFFSGDNVVTSCCCTTGHRAFIPNTTSEDRIRIREEEATQEARQLGAKAKFLRLPLYDRGSVMGDEDLQAMITYLREAKPDLIFLPHTGDTHPTHRAVLYTILQALAHIMATDTGATFELFMYEGPWSLFPPGSYNTIISPPGECFAKKLAAIRAHVSQTDRTPYDKAADALAQLRAALVPEQDLGGFGENPPHLEDRLELFFHFVVSSAQDVQSLISVFHEEKAPTATSLRSSTS